ncbi:MAG TPA: hypothetical protein VGB99_15855 [Acidobacteriota bacterium]|jgi:hypothetical protein
MRSNSLRGQSGQIGLKHLLGFGLIAVLVYAGLEIIPKVVAVYDFEDEVQTQALLAGGQFSSEQEIQEAIQRAARENELEIDLETVAIAQRGFERVITLDYTVPFELFGKTLHWRRQVQKGQFAP